MNAYECVFVYVYIYICMYVCDSSNIYVHGDVYVASYICRFWVLHLLYVFICDMLVSSMTALDFRFSVEIDVKRDESCGRNH